ncbi:MAG: DUF4159 domain-containing protein, partial [Verrucomicrobiota bacterium]
GGIVRLEEGNGFVDEATVHTAREAATHSVDVPVWTNSPQFKHDTFTFTRMIFHKSGGGGGRGGGGLGWQIDYPDADLNVSGRLQQMSSLKVDPDTRVVRLTDPDLYRYPYLYAVHVENIRLSDPERAALRKHLRTGGTLMVSDFWGSQAWDSFAAEMVRVLPGQQWVDLPFDHPVFHGVFDLKLPLSNLQVPTNSRLQAWNRAYDPSDPNSRATLPRPDASTLDMHVRAWLDDKGHIMIIALHNTDISDGWEREGESPEYFNLFSETRAYPLMINILYYLMTH